MESDNRARLKQWLESGEARLQPLSFPQRELWETSPVETMIHEVKGSYSATDSWRAWDCDSRQRSS
jgi:hypothetical protein